MQEQHKAMFVALRDGQYDAMVEFDVAPPPTASAALDDAAPPTVPPPEPEAPRNTAPPAEVVAARSLAPPPRSSLTPTVGTRITGAMAAPLPGRSTSSATPVGGARTTGRTSLRSTGAREAPAVPGSLIPPRLPAVEEPPKNPPVFSNSMRYTAPRMVAPSILPPARERAVSSDAFMLERTLDELILAMLSDELSV
jgi:hypothetical protein